MLPAGTIVVIYINTLQKRDLLTFPGVGSTASIGHFWAAADAAAQVSALPFACPEGAPRLAGQGWPKAIAARRVSALDA